MCKPPVAPLRQSHKTQIFFILILSVSLALQFLIVLPSKSPKTTHSNFRLKNYNNSLCDHWAYACGFDSFSCCFNKRPWIPQTRQQLHGFTFQYTFLWNVSRLWSSTDTKVQTLCNLQPMCRKVWSPLPLHKQLCRYKESQRISCFHHILVYAHSIGDNIKYPSSCWPL